MLEAFVNGAEKQHLNIDSIIITKGGERFSHYFTDNTENNIRSISKTISCLGAYKAIERGYYSIETNILQFFDADKITNARNLEQLKHMKIKHLLNLTIGQNKGLMFSKDIKQLPEGTDLLYYILNYDMDYTPGSHFVYNNAATYLLCYITQSLSGMYYGDWVNETLFKYMDIHSSKWEASPQGICLGASGLWLNNNDLHKIAIMLLNEGEYNGEQLISKDWIATMHTPHFFTADLPEYASKQSRCINKMSYGYGLWICGDGSKKYPKTHYFCDGTDGQLLIVSPKQKMAITILSHQKDMNPIYELLRIYLD